MAHHLAQAYATAFYEVDLHGGTVRFRVGGMPPVRLVGGEEAGPAERAALPLCLAVVTAYNPGDERPDGAVNEAANAALQREIEAMGAVWYPAVGRSPDGGHQEPSFGVVGVTCEVAVALGRRFRQAAVFWWDGAMGAMGAVGAVAWCMAPCKGDAAAP